MTDGQMDGQRRLQYPRRFFKKAICAYMFIQAFMSLLLHRNYTEMYFKMVNSKHLNG